MNRFWARAWPPSRIGLRLLAFNLLVVFVPVIGVLYLDVYEAQLLQAQEREMVQQGRVLAAAAARTGALDAEDMQQILVRLGRDRDARFRLFDASGKVVADSAHVAIVPAVEKPSGTPSADNPGIRTRLLYRLGAWMARLRQRLGAVRALLRPAPAAVVDSGDDLATIVRTALSGRYAATTGHTPGQRSLTLFSALPVRAGDTVIGAVVVSQSTFRALQAIYDVRLRIFEVVVASVAAAAVLTTLAAMTIVRPLRRLRRQATALTEGRGPMPASFPGSRRRDELGDLARALEELTRRVDEQIARLEGFAADVAHEFKNPLASIRTAAEMTGQSERQEDRDRFLAMMMRDIDRLERLVSGAREMARVDGALQSEGVDDVPVVLAIQDAADSVRSASGDREIVVDARADRIVVRGARERLAQVFENILSNAVSFAPSGTRIDVQVGIREANCAVTISDRGPGIPPGNLDRVFDRFFSYRPSGRGQHVGLGLAIARRIVESYGGTITARNRDGGGATFEILLRRSPVGVVQHWTTTVPSYSARRADSGSTFSARREGT